MKRSWTLRSSHQQNNQIKKNDEESKNVNKLEIAPKTQLIKPYYVKNENYSDISSLN